jgi:two-component system response regulator
MENTHILLVKDNLDDKLLLLRACKTSDLHSTIMTVQDGVEAINYLLGLGPFEGRPLPSLVLLDLNLPKVDGVEVLARIRAQAEIRALPVIVLSSSEQPADRRRCYELGANSYLRKPTDFAKLRDLMEMIESYWLGWNQGPPPPNKLD